MQKKQLPPVSMVKEDISEFYAITTDIFHVHHLYVTQKVNSKKKVVGFLSFKTQPNLMLRNFKLRKNECQKCVLSRYLGQGF